MRLRTRIAARVMGGIASAGWERFRQARGRLPRRLVGGPATLHYFHQVDDPYSHLAVQRLAALARRWRVNIVPQLVPPPADAFKGDAQRYPLWALADACDVAPFYGVEAPAREALPDPVAVQRVTRILASQGPGRFASAAVALGRQLWDGNSFADAVLPSEALGRARLATGERLRTRLGHYMGGMFHFEGDWYWGLDRLCHLEARLAREGFALDASAPPCVPRPQPEPLQGDASGVTLEVFPSLRSPYTAVSFRRTLEMAARTGVRLELRPVMPMMMRGVPAPRVKQLYIMTDAAREGRASGQVIGRPVDPFGEPVRRALSLWSWAHDEGRGAEFLAEYLDAAWIEGLDITTDAGIETVVERAGLDWVAGRELLGGTESDAQLEDNVQAMLAAGLWGVPSYRVSGGAQAGTFACWGQDRLWRVETEIARRAVAST